MVRNPGYHHRPRGADGNGCWALNGTITIPAATSSSDSQTFLAAAYHASTYYAPTGPGQNLDDRL